MMRRRRSLADLDEDVRDHIERETADNIGRGMTPADARDAALRKFGSVALAKEDARSVWIPVWFDQLLQDARYAVRMFRRAPGFSLVVVFTLALGIGATTAIFSVVNNLLLTPPPFKHAERLVTVVDTNPEKVPPDADTPPSPGNVLDWRDRMRSVDAIAAWRNWYYAVSSVDAGPGTPESVRGVRVSPAFFSMLGVEPALGRTFRDDEEVPGADAVVVLSDRLWSRRFGSDPAIVGGAILVDGRPTTVIGVLPRNFQFYQPDLELWMPLPIDAGMHARADHSTMVFARLAPETTIAAAQTELNGITRQLEREHPETNTGWGARVIPLYPTRETRNLKPALLVLFGAAAFVLLIACVNVANLLYGRAIVRRREIAVRAAIGATRGRLLRQMAAESIVLAGGAAAAGVVIASWAVPPLTALLPHADTNQGVGQFGASIGSIDARMLGFVLALTLGTAALFGLLPALQTTRDDELRGLRSTARASAKRMLMIAELAMSVVLLIGAALLLESFWRLQRINPGFRTDHLLTMQVALPRAKYAAPADMQRFYDRALRDIAAAPGVIGAGAVSFRPFLGMAMGTRLDIDGRPSSASADDILAGYCVVSPGYLRVLGQRIVHGREFVDADEADSVGVAIVNQTMASRLWPNENPVGRRIRPAFSRTNVPWAVDAEPRWLTIVGVADDIKEFRLDEQTRPVLYVTYRQFPTSFMYLTVRTATAPAALAGEVQRAIAAIDRDQPVYDIRTMDDAIAAAVPRFHVALLAVFAAVAVVLSAIGVYGVMSYIVGQRTQEIGIRMALGASARQVMVAMMREVAALGVLGIAVGLIAAAGLTRLLSGMLFGVAPTDARAFAGAAALLLAVAVTACGIPAKRATRVDPIVALRCE